MGVSAALVGLMMMAARFVDAITDVTMGQIVDRSRPGKKGKFAPWLRRMCGPVALASFLMYATWFKDMPMGFKIFWMFFTYLLWGSICYTGLIFLMVQWHQRFQTIRQTELLFLTGER